MRLIWITCLVALSCCFDKSCHAEYNTTETATVSDKLNTTTEQVSITNITTAAPKTVDQNATEISRTLTVSENRVKRAKNSTRRRGSRRRTKTKRPIKHVATVGAGAAGAVAATSLLINKNISAHPISSDAHHDHTMTSNTSAPISSTAVPTVTTVSSTAAQSSTSTPSSGTVQSSTNLTSTDGTVTEVSMATSPSNLTTENLTKTTIKDSTDNETNIMAAGSLKINSEVMEDHHDQHIFEEENLHDDIASLQHFDISQERFCTRAQHCRLELNERCVVRNERAMCGCSRSFFRNPQTMVCEKKAAVTATLHLPRQQFLSELSDTSSPEFSMYKNNAEALLRQMMSHSKYLRETTLQLQVTSFKIGRNRSTIAKVRTAVQADPIWDHHIDDIFSRYRVEFTDALDVWNPDILKHTSILLRTDNMHVVDINVEMNACADDSLNYCSTHAVCSRSRITYHFACRCRLGYADISPDKEHFPGEHCITECRPNECLNGGKCLNGNHGIICECAEGYIGAKCQYNASQIAAVFTITGISLFGIFAAVLFRYYWRTKRDQKQNVVRKMIVVKPRGQPMQAHRETMRRKSIKEMTDKALAAKKNLFPASQEESGIINQG